MAAIIGGRLALRCSALDGSNYTEEVSETSRVNLCVLEVGNSLCHPGDAGDDVAMGDRDPLGDARGAAGVHDDGDVRRLRLSGVSRYCAHRQDGRCRVEHRVLFLESNGKNGSR